MFPIEAFRRTLGKATDIFRQLGIRFHLTGGVAAVYYAEPRLTHDIDIVIDTGFHTNLRTSHDPKSQGAFPVWDGVIGPCDDRVRRVCLGSSQGGDSCIPLYLRCDSLVLCDGGVEGASQWLGSHHLILVQRWVGRSRSGFVGPGLRPLVGLSTRQRVECRSRNSDGRQRRAASHGASVAAANIPSTKKKMASPQRKVKRLPMMIPIHA